MKSCKIGGGGYFLILVIVLVLCETNCDQIVKKKVRILRTKRPHIVPLKPVEAVKETPVVIKEEEEATGEKPTTLVIVPEYDLKERDPKFEPFLPTDLPLFQYTTSSEPPQVIKYTPESSDIVKYFPEGGAEMLTTKYSPEPELITMASMGLGGGGGGRGGGGGDKYSDLQTANSLHYGHGHGIGFGHHGHHGHHHGFYRPIIFPFAHRHGFRNYGFGLRLGHYGPGFGFNYGRKYHRFHAPGFGHYHRGFHKTFHFFG